MQIRGRDRTKACLRAAACGLLLTGASWALPLAAGAAGITVTTTQPGVNGDAFCSLQEAIYSANFDSNTFVDPGRLGQGAITVACEAGDGDDTIVLAENAVYLFPLDETSIVNDPFNYMGPTATPIVFTRITIEGNGARLERPNTTHDFSGVLFRAFAIGFVAAIAPSQGGVTGKTGTGALTLRNLHIKGFEVKGGNGAAGGGGGMGAGGAIYANGALTVEGCTFEGNGARGGRGGFTLAVGPGGGGGGLGGDGGEADAHAAFDPNDPDGGVIGAFKSGGGGGGGGARGSGGANGGFSPPFEGWWANGDGGGGGGTLSSGERAGEFSGGGYRCGGAGGAFDEDGFGATCFGGGGGGGGTPSSSLGFNTGVGGDGDYGGGGGGGGFRFTIVNNFSAPGGKGGFGGGGGAGSETDDGGSSTVGGGGGAGTREPGEGGTFGGRGGHYYGGGGAALGGAIFSHGATVVIDNSTFVGNYVLRGEVPSIPGFSDTAEFGRGRGGAVFSVWGDVTVRNSTFSHNESTGQSAAIHVYHPDSDVLIRLTEFHLYNTIIANHDGANACQLHADVDADGAGNLIQTNLNCQGSVGDGDPLLGPLQLNAPGMTPTMAIGFDSAAYNTADPATSLPTDQRGVPRPQSSGYDIGAFEFIRPSADLAVSTTTVGEPVAGQYFSWVIDVINFGPTYAETVKLTDVLPAGVIMSSVTGSGGFSCQGDTTITCTKGQMKSGDVASFTLTVLIPSGYAAQSIANTVTVTSDIADPNKDNNSASVAANVTRRASVVTIVTGPSVVLAGTDVTYSLRVDNHGPSDAIGLRISNVIPEGTSFVSLGPVGHDGWTCGTLPVVGGTGAVSCTLNALSRNSATVLTLKVHTSPSLAAATDTLCNFAAVSVNTLDPVVTDNGSLTCASVQASADVALTSLAPVTGGSPGKGTATFTLKVQNTGVSDAAGLLLTARSTLFSGAPPIITATPSGSCTVAGTDIACSWPSLALNGTNAVVITVPWKSSLGDVCVAATVTAGSPDPNAANNTASACIGKKK